MIRSSEHPPLGNVWILSYSHHFMLSDIIHTHLLVPTYIYVRYITMLRVRRRRRRPLANRFYVFVGRTATTKRELVRIRACSCVPVGARPAPSRRAETGAEAGAGWQSYYRCARDLTRRNTIGRPGPVVVSRVIRA